MTGVASSESSTDTHSAPFFIPLTALAYAFAVNSNGSVTGFYLVLVVVAVLVDLGLIGGGEASR